jgi:hypothetical protein
MHLPGDSPVESWGIDYDREVRPAPVGLFDEAVKAVIYLRQLTQDFCDADHRQIAGIDNGIASRGSHALPSYAKELQGGIAPLQSFNQPRAIHFSGSLASGDQNSHHGVLYDLGMCAVVSRPLRL